MTPEPDPEFCRKCWSRIDIGLGPCSVHQEDPKSRGQRGVERTRDALAEGVHAKETRKPLEAKPAMNEGTSDE